MSLFKVSKDNSNNYGSPLIAAAMAAKAGASYPAADKVINYLNKSLDEMQVEMVGKELSEAGGKLLKQKMLAKELQHLPIVAGKSNYFTKVPKDYLPSKKQFMRALNKGGYEGIASVKLDPLKLVRDARDSGGYVSFMRENPITVAHELGHASMLNPTSKIRGSKLYDIIELASRRSGTKRNALLAALVAGSFDSEDKSKWAVPALVAATQAPVLAEEGIASFKAMKALKDVAKTNPEVISKEMLSKAGPYLRRAWGTYGARSAGMLAAPIAAIGARSYFDDWLKE